MTNINDALIVRFHEPRFHEPEHGPRLGIRRDDGNVYDITATFGTFGAWLQASTGRVEAAINDLLQAAESATSQPASRYDNAPHADRPHWLPPVDVQDVWASGVTYERSRAARQEEAIDGGDVYARVYDATRPELFFKARGPWVVGHLHEVGIRSDAVWNVPEPELTLVLNPALEVVGFCAGNDMSSRDIEGENPLYLPQAKVYTASCALGPGIRPGMHQQWPPASIHITIQRDDQTIVDDSVHTESIRRTLPELVEYLGRSNTFADGVFLMTGTGIIPPNDFTLHAGDRVTIQIDGIGTLVNTVKVV
ncbi:MAG: 2-hydroxyhepta-2,4-diene-1,7-dioate isomerase [Anaerolineaceae bacterium]|nr:MAG: 2-hydroxyhepta-2,4-diene-1,7-dioate isomerase [Anaerolineaceae bacterium]